MVRVAPALSLVFLVACSGGDPKDPAGSPTDTGPVTPTLTVDSSSGLTDTDTATQVTDSTVAPTGDTGPVPAASLTAVSGAVHAEHGSIVVVSWEQDQAADVWVEYSFEVGSWRQTPLRSEDAGAHQELLLGVPYATDVTWRVVTDNAGGQVSSLDQTTTTDPLPASVPVSSITTYDEAGVDADAEYVLVSVPQNPGNFGDPWWVLIVDRLGRPVWGRQSDAGRMSMHPRLSWDGTAILHDQNQFWSEFGLGEDGTVQKVRIDGTIVHEWPAPGLHHPHQELPDGSLAYGAFTSYYDESLAVTAPDDSISYLWSCDEWATGIGAYPACASNTLNYDEATDTFLFSFWTLETVIQIDGAGTALRWFGHAPDSYAFSPVSSTFWFQHGAHLTDAGTLLISTHQTETDKQLVAREYTIDTVAEELVEVWNVGVDQGVIGNQMGDAYRTPGGHTLQTYGTQSRMREYQPDGTVVWDISFPQVSHVGRATALPDLYALAPEQP